MKYNILKKAAAFGLSTAILLYGLVCTAFAAGEYDRERVILSQMGIADIADTDSVITRYEFLLYAMRMARNPDEIFGTVKRQIFTDVSLNSQYSGLVSAAFDMGVIVVGDNGLFDGTSGVTLEQGATMLCRALNYNLINESVINTAMKFGLFDGVSGHLSDKLDGKNAIKLLYNALEANTLIVSSDGSIKDSGNTVMGDIHAVGYIEGVVTDDFTGGIYGDVPRSKNSLFIGEYEIQLSQKYLCESFLGQRVRVYYRKNKDDSIEAIYIEPKNTNLLSIEREDIISLEPLELRYYDGEKKKKAKLKADTVVLVNGERILITGKYDIPAAADIHLADNNNDGVYEFVFIDEFKPVYVNGIDTERMKIYNKISKIGTVELSEFDNIICKSTNNEEIDFKDLASGDILRVYLYKNSDRAVIKQARKTVGFDVKNLEKRTEGDFEVYYLHDADGNEYKTNILFMNTAEKEITVGNYYNFALDDKDEIAAIGQYSTQSGFIYAYIYKAYINETDEDCLTVELYTEEGSFEKCSVKKKVYCVNDNGNMLISTLSGRLSANGMIRCQINDGVMKKIEFPSDDLYYNGMKFIGASSITSNTNGENRYYGSMRNLGGQIAMKSDTKVMIIPAESDKSNKELYGITSVSYFKSDNYYPGVVGYGSDEKGFMADIVVIQGLQGSSLNSKPMLVTQVSEEYDAVSDGTRYAITGYESGRLKKYILNNQLKPEYIPKTTGMAVPIEEGDSIRINFDQNQEINYLKLMFDESEKMLYGVNDKNDDEITYGNGGFHTWGTMYSKDDGRFRVIRSGTDKFSTDIYSTDSTTYIYEYDSSQKKNRKIRQISLDDIESVEDIGAEADKIFVYMYKPPCSLIVLYK